MVASETSYVFDRFVLSHGGLSRDGLRVRLGGRATSLLLALVERAGELVTKDQLSAAAWPGELIEDGNLRVHLTALRRALGDSSEAPRFIANVPGRGYRFVARVEAVSASNLRPDRAPFTPERPAAIRLPGTLQPASLVGRDAELEILAENLQSNRLVTVVGPGGVGKTTIAVATARRLQARFTDGVYFIDLAAVAEPGNVAFAIASTLETSIDVHAPQQSLVAHLAHRRMLLLFDNSEHLIDAVARLAEAITRVARGVTILATSHEPLLVEGEVVVRLLPFRVPSAALASSLAAAMTHPAIQLFVEHALAGDDQLRFGDADVTDLIDICRKLDGLPLALEIAAARAGTLGLHALNLHLDDRFDLLTAGRRTAAPRHRTLRSLFDWSYGNLSETDQAVLRRLSVFPGDFTVDAGVALAGDVRISRHAATDALDRLLRRSLLVAGNPGAPWLRLPESTRLYLAEQLDRAGEAHAIHSAHAANLCDALRQAEAAWAGSEPRDWLARHGGLIDEVRAALHWAWSEDGDAGLGVSLTTLSMYLAFQLGQTEEFYARGQFALDRASRLATPQRLDELRLHIACHTYAYVRQLPYDQHLTRMTEVADAIGTLRARLEVALAHANARLTSGRYAEALECCEAALLHARGDEFGILATEKVMAQVHHFLGNQRRTVELANRVLRHPTLQIPLHYGFMHADRRVSLRVMLARALWLTGSGDSALRVADEARSYAFGAEMVQASQILALAEIPILLWRGEPDLAGVKVRQLHERATRFGFKEYLAWAESFEAALGLRPPPASLDLGCVPDQQLATFIGADNPVFTGINWSTPELLRVRGLSAIARGRRAEGLVDLEAALALARQQGAIAWELRAATSLARHWRDGPRHDEAVTTLADVLHRLPEGHQTADPLAAHRLLSELRERETAGSL